MLIFIQKKKRRRAYAIMGILIVGTVLTYAMVALFFLGAFSFGHNSLVKPADQFIIDAVMTAGLLVYGFIGWFLRRFVHE